MNVSLAKKIQMAVLVFSATLVAVTFSSSVISESISTKLVDLSNEGSAKIGLSFRIAQSLSTLNGTVQEVLRQKEADAIEAALAKVDEKRKSLEASLLECGKNCDAIKTALVEANEGYDKAIGYLLQGNLADAYEYFTNTVSKSEEKVLAQVNSFSSLVKSDLEKKTSDTLETAKNLKSMSLLIAGLLGAVITVFGLVFSKSIKDRLGKTTHSLSLISKGDFAVRLETKPQDELGQVGNVVNHLATEISQLVKSIEKKNAELKEMNEGLETTVLSRTRTIRTILDNVKSGFFLVQDDLIVQPGFTKSCQMLFSGRCTEGESISKMLDLSTRDAENFAFLARQVFDDFLPEDLSLSQIPSRFLIDNRVLQLDGSAIRGESGKIVEAIMFSVTDITLLERAQTEVKEIRSLLEIVKNKPAFEQFLQDFEKDLHDCRLRLTKSEDKAQLKRLLHTLKGNAGLFGLVEVAARIHKIEDKSVVAQSDLNDIQEDLRLFLSNNAEVLGDISSFASQGKQETLHQRQKFKNIPEKLLFELEHAVVSNQFGVNEAEFIKQWLRKSAYVPAAHYLSQFEKEALKLINALGKQAQVDVTGLETMVCPTTLGNTLKNVIHLVRNAADHGLELPSERTGKPDIARVSVRITQTASDWKICIEDDGRGIDSAKVSAAALKRGAITAEKLLQMKENEIFELILLQEVSTAETVTDVSGRGVGMSAVAECVRDARGTLSISSVLGKGTQFEITVPFPT